MSTQNRYMTDFGQFINLPSFFRIVAIALIVVLGSFVSVERASAYQAGWNGGNTLLVYNWDTFSYAALPWTADSSVGYVKVWDASGSYTRVDTATHQAKTNTNWTGFSSYLSAHVTTTLYSGGVYMGSYSSLNGSCVIPPWSIWWCDSGTLGWSFYGDGSGTLAPP